MDAPGPETWVGLKSGSSEMLVDKGGPLEGC
jgi:hypothetical protein